MRTAAPVSALALWAVAVLTSGCTAGTAAPASTPGQPDRVSAGVIAIVDVAPIYLGKQKGFFSKRDIDLTLETGQGGAAIVPGVLGVELAFPDMPAALQAGRVDATVAAYFATQQLIAANPGLVRRFREAMAESLRYANEHPEEVRTVLGSYMQIAPDVAAKMTLPMWPEAVNTTSVRALADLAVDDGLLDRAPNLTDLLP
jgi:NitT/TauT family transport system substrate-binding protein